MEDKKLENETNMVEQESIFMSLLQKILKNKPKIEEIDKEISKILVPVDLFVVNEKYLIGTAKVIIYMRKQKGDRAISEIADGTKLPQHFVEEIIKGSKVLEVSMLGGKPRKIGRTKMYKLADNFKKF